MNRLETVKIPIYNPISKKNIWVRAFLDSGSNLSAISKECFEKCGLKAGIPETIFLSTFQNKLKRQTFSRTNIDVYKNTEDFQGNVSFHPYIMQKVMEPIKSYPISERQEKYFRENNITLSDTDLLSKGKLKVDLLIGQDFLHHFYNSRHKFIAGG